jgi:hypothetical protein
VPVKAKYRKYFGKHPDHPGTGKGPGANRRSKPTQGAAGLGPAITHD